MYWNSNFEVTTTLSAQISFTEIYLKHMRLIYVIYIYTSCIQNIDTIIKPSDIAINKIIQPNVLILLLYNENTILNKLSNLNFINEKKFKTFNQIKVQFTVILNS